MPDRILWNPGDDGDIDEIVLHNVTVHIEQMNDRCWWIGLTRPDGTSWDGDFTANSRGHMRFTEQENNGISWERIDTHEETEGPPKQAV